MDISDLKTTTSSNSIIAENQAIKNELISTNPFSKTKGKTTKPSSKHNNQVKHLHVMTCYMLYNLFCSILSL